MQRWQTVVRLFLLTLVTITVGILYKAHFLTTGTAYQLLVASNSQFRETQLASNGKQDGEGPVQPSASRQSNTRIHNNPGGDNSQSAPRVKSLEPPIDMRSLKKDVVKSSLGNSAWKTCSSPVTHFFFSKIEKTGSSTLYTIFARFIQRHKLNVMTMTQNFHLDTRRSRGSIPGWDIGPHKDQLADALIDHGRFNQSLIEHYMHADVKYITCIREPVSWFKSAASYFVLNRKMEPDTVINTPSRFFSERPSYQLDSYYHLNQMLWLGFNYSQRENVTAMKEHIRMLQSRFDLVMLNDQFDASLIILKRRLCWTHLDILYKSSVMTHSSTKALSNESIATLLSERYNLGDKLLYDAFNRTWWEQPEVKDPDFWEEVQHFINLNRQHNSMCLRVKVKRKAVVIPASRWGPEQLLTKFDCDILRKRAHFIYLMHGHYALGNSYAVVK